MVHIQNEMTIMNPDFHAYTDRLRKMIFSQFVSIQQHLLDLICYEDVAFAQCSKYV